VPKEAKGKGKELNLVSRDLVEHKEIVNVGRLTPVAGTIEESPNLVIIRSQ
jgi:hypothetical protein